MYQNRINRFQMISEELFLRDIQLDINLFIAMLLYEFESSYFPQRTPIW